MGGSAFSAVLPASSFPRIPIAVYQAVKSHLLPKLGSVYSLVGVPTEAPEKRDYGDLDFLVANPISSTASVQPSILQDILGARYLIPMEGNRTSNYAIPISRGHWSVFGYEEEELLRRSEAESGEIYYQVDVHVCEDRPEWDRVMFFHSYGDMGMILGLIARNAGLHLGSKGLKITDPPHPPFHLSTSFDRILEFLGLSSERLNKGFATEVDVFQWVTSTKYFDASNFRTTGPGISKVKAERKMYARFISWLQEERDKNPSSGLSSWSYSSMEEKRARLLEEALVFFELKTKYVEMVRERQRKALLKEVFSGSRVRDWCELGEHWKGVKLVMDEVRLRLGGADKILEFVAEHGEDALKEVVLKVKADLPISSHQLHPPSDDN